MEVKKKVKMVGEFINTNVPSNLLHRLFAVTLYSIPKLKFQYLISCALIFAIDEEDLKRIHSGHHPHYCSQALFIMH